MDCKLLIAVACCLALLHDTEAAVATSLTATASVANGATNPTVTLSFSTVTNGFCAVTSGSATVSPTVAGAGVTSCTLTITGTTDYSVATSHSIGYSVTDAAAGGGEATETVVVSVTKNPYIPSILTACPAYSAAVDTVVSSFTTTVTPVSGDTVTYTITGGNTDGYFDITGTTLTVATILPSTASTYTLTLTLDPADAGSVNGAATVVVSVGDWCQCSSGVAGMAASIVLVTTAILFSLMKQL